MIIQTIVTNPLGAEEARSAKQAYVGSGEQALTYGDPPPEYARILTGLIASMRPRSVLEFGCNGGRNLQLVRQRLEDCRLVGVDVNHAHIEKGRELFHGLELETADEEWLDRQPKDAFEVAFTVSVIDHIPYPEAILRNLLRITRDYLVLFECAYDRIGKATHNLYISENSAELKPAFRYSYIHDYRHECERKFGAHCLLDAHFPIGRDNLLDLYRLYIFSKREDLRDRSTVSELKWVPIKA